MSHTVAMTMTQAWDLKVFLEYGQFYLEPGLADDDPYWEPVDDTSETLQQALGWNGTEYTAHDDAPSIAQGRYSTVVTTPHRDNFDMDLRVEMLDGPAVDDSADWQEIFEATVAAGPTGIWYHTPTLDSTRLEIPVGIYRLRISGRDFLRPVWVDDGSVGYDDKYRFQFWPETQPIASIRLKRWEHPEICGHI